MCARPPVANLYRGIGVGIPRAGDVLFIPARTNHAAKNVGTVNASELATYVVEKGKSLLVLATK